MALNTEYGKSGQGALKIFELITICIAFSCLADFERELELAKFYDKICSEVRLVHGGFRDWLGSGPSGVLGLPVQLDGERLESCTSHFLCPVCSVVFHCFWSHD
ncbi:unnamed protein product [Porites evermanni]|uniref:Uncharacterized protein n=1 Tax=Porites evermanni TaxID=104178 RepID=A0ABN8PR88_9CNID|nr:unnamed protein product [Porites evermanni]